MICPLCKKIVAQAEPNRFRPFCSERCQTIDLGHWAQETYRLPLVDEEEDEGKAIEDHP